MIRFFDNSISTCPGNPIRDVYESFVLENGEIEVRCVGKEDWFGYIQSFRECTDISNILTRVNNGEVDLLNVSKGVYGDFTNMPKTYAEMLQLQIDSEKMFNKLTPEMREKFGNDKNQFFAQAGSEEWFDKLGILKKEEKTEESEVSVKE